MMNKRINEYIIQRQTLIIFDNNVIVRLTFCTKRAVPTGRAFARERRVSVFAHTAPFVLALEFGARHFLVTRVPGEFLSDQTRVCEKEIPVLRAKIQYL